MQSSNVDICRVSGSTTGREWITGSDLKLKFTLLFVTYFQRVGKHHILENVSTDQKLRNFLQFYPLLFIRAPFLYLVKSRPGKLDPQIQSNPSMPAFDKGVGIINTQLTIIPIFEQRQINVDLNNVRQRRNNIVIFNVDLHINEYDH